MFFQLLFHFFQMLLFCNLRNSSVSLFITPTSFLGGLSAFGRLIALLDFILFRFLFNIWLFWDDIPQPALI